MLERYFSRLPRLFSWSSVAVRHEASRRDFSRMVCRERARADRSGGDFSVLTFRAQPIAGESQVLRQIAKHMAERARIIDQYGWNGESAIWLLLPHCPPDAAEKIAHDICDRFSTADETVGFELYHYKGDKGQPRDDHSRSSDVDAGAPAASNAASQPVGASLELAREPVQ